MVDHFVAFLIRARRRIQLEVWLGVQQKRYDWFTPDAIAELIAALHRHAGLNADDEPPFTARTRHVDALRRCAECVTAARAQLADETFAELAAEELRLAHDALGEITGRFSSEDLLGRIFAGFCIGK